MQRYGQSIACVPVLSPPATSFGIHSLLRSFMTLFATGHDLPVQGGPKGRFTYFVLQSPTLVTGCALHLLTTFRSVSDSPRWE